MQYTFSDLPGQVQTKANLRQNLNLESIWLLFIQNVYKVKQSGITKLKT